MRSAISRAYYCAFHTAKAYIRRTEPAFDTKKHYEVWEKFQNMDGMEDVESNGDRARILRVRADYQNQILRPADELRTAMNHVKKVIAKLS